MSVGAKLGIGLLRAVYRLPLGVQAAIGQGVGALMHALAGSRRRIALRNVALCFPHMDVAERRRLVREHFGWLGRSVMERGLLWYAPVERLKRLIHVEGDVTLAERSQRPVMWLVPHFLALDVAGVATQIFQARKVGSIYQAQSNPVWDAEIRKGRLRFDQGQVFPRSDTALPLVRAIRRGWAFFNLPDMDFGRREAAFVPFFGVPAATLLAPSKMARALDMVVQPVVAEMLPGGRGYKVKFLPAWDDWPTDNPEADAARMNRWIEEQIRHCPAQYLWVHKRFKTRPEGEASLYA
ncbi:LpxL/LpxP family acyltransferase [Azohydromonas lata]|uniref:Lipid A biosynthesis acyltransferase n=1 Tax=Azohydromonas lata TaxID=45677 RepID=A0ABU5IR52_9BURK|nr:lipid A biosynthesis acyltransferase [Azohydromonas lata]MDZ5461358.1 lipid A biosynthesis acyltransferase [Azohydromonas lata]